MLYSWGGGFILYAEDEKIGYVANKDYMKFELTSYASELQNKLEILLVRVSDILFRPTDLQHYDMQLYIGRIIK